MSFDKSKPSVLLEFNAAAQPSLDEVKRLFKLADNEIDEKFGVIALAKQDYVIVVSAEAGKRIEKASIPGFKQNWSNPPIGPM